MLRSKISIVLAPKVMKEVESVANENDIKVTEFLTFFIEEIFFHKKEDLIKILQEIPLEIPNDFGKFIDSDDIRLPYKTKEIIIPDVCPECGESEDILGNKVLYEVGGYIHCKSCMGKFEVK